MESPLLTRLIHDTRLGSWRTTFLARWIIYYYSISIKIDIDNFLFHQKFAKKSRGLLQDARLSIEINHRICFEKTLCQPRKIDTVRIKSLLHFRKQLKNTAKRFPLATYYATVSRPNIFRHISLSVYVYVERLHISPENFLSHPFFSSLFIPGETLRPCVKWLITLQL